MPLVYTQIYKKTLSTLLLMRLNSLVNNRVVDELGTSVPSPFTSTKIGVTTAKAQSGTRSHYSGGNPEALLTAATAPFTFTGDFTIEFFCWLNGKQTAGLFDIGGIVNINWQSQSMWVGTAGYLHYFAFSNASTGGSQAGSTIINNGISSKPCLIDAWNHIAITRAGNTYSVYLNGERVLTVNSALAPYAPTYNTIIGHYPNGAQTGFANADVSGFDGYMDNWRVTKGVARYTGDTYAVPVTPFGKTLATDPHWNNVSLLLDMETVDANGVPVDAKGTAFSHFREGTQSYTFGGLRPAQDLPAFNAGASGYMRLQDTKLNLGQRDFTMEVWLHITQTNSAFKTIFGTRKGKSLDDGFGFSVGLVNSNLALYIDKFVIPASGTVTLNSWRHVALVRKNDVFTLYLHGVAIGSYSASVYDLQHNVIGLAGNPDGTQLLGVSGTYLSDFRVSDTARYTSNFTPSTVPLKVD